MKIVFTFLLFFIFGCVNRYENFFQESELYKKNRNNFYFFNGKPAIIFSNSPNEDLLKYYRKGFIKIGFSNFNGNSNNSISDIESFAKKLGAEIVLWNYKYTHTISGSYPITNYSSNPYQTSTTHIPYSVAKYDYNAIFLGKSNIENKFGAHFIDLDREQKIRLKISGGAIIKFIFENSLAFNSKLLEGDIITHIQNHKIEDVNDLDNFINIKLDYSKNIEVLYLRDGIKGKDIIKILSNKKSF